MGRDDMKISFPSSLRGRLILLLLAASVMLVSLVAWDFLEHRAERIHAARTELLGQARVIAARQQFIVDQAAAILENLMLSPESSPQTPAATCNQFLLTRIKQQQAFAQAGRLLPDGELACSALAAADRVSHANLAWFQQALQSRAMVVSDVMQGRLLGKPVIVFAKAMRDESGRVTGVYFITLDLAWLRRELAAARQPQGTRLAVADAKGTIAVRHPDPEGLAGKNVANLPLLQQIKAAGGEGTVEEIDLYGKRRLYAFVKLLDTVSGPAYVWLARPLDAIEAPALRAAWINLGITLAVLAAALGLVLWGAGRLVVGPLLKISRALERFSAGDLGMRSGLPHGDDEIGRLARILDETAASIEERETKLAYANRALRVLSASNRTLLHVDDEQELLNDMCRAIVEAGDYRMAWVGYAESDKSVRPAASWGAEADFLDTLNVTWDEGPSGRGPTGTAIRHDIPVACGDVRTDPDCGPWRQHALRHGYVSLLALPLRKDGAIIGALNIHAAEADAFDQDAIELFSEAAGDLSYGIAARRARAEHARTLDELKRLEDKTALILNSAGEGIVGVDLEGRATFINPAGSAMLQWSAEEAIGQVMHDLHHHTRADGTPYPRAECPIYAAYRDGTAHRVADEFFWRKDGSRFPVDYASTPMRDGTGRLVGAVLTFSDVTERKRAEQALRDSEERFLLAVESVRDGFIVVDSETGAIVLWNSAAAAIFGYTKDEAIGQSLHRLITPPRFREAADAGMAHFGRSGEGAVIGKTQELAALRRDGTEFPIELSLSAMQLGGRWHAAGLVRDITLRRADEEHLRKLTLAIEQSPESIVITNVDAKIEYVNEAFVRVTGYARAEAVGQNPRFLHSGRTPAETYASLWAALSGGNSWKGEFINKRKDGGVYVEFANVTPIRQTDGRITHYVAVKEDITEKKRLGEELDQHRHHLQELVEQRTKQLTAAQERAEAANRAKSAFLANMSHEIRTPMNAIIGLTHLLRRAGPTPEQAVRLIKIDGAAQHLLSIINDILDLSKIEAGRVQLESTDFHLAAILDNIRSLIADQASAKGLAIEIDTRGVPACLRGDPTRLRQALLNYAGNAVKFTDRGAITLRARLLEDDGENLLVRFEVQDMGIGIAADKLAQLFRAFEQADASTTRKYGGTGLGLTITRRLASLMGGEAGVDSTEGRGSTFWLTARLQRGHGILPTDSIAVAVTAETELRGRHGGARILLAEDNLINREVALELLHGVGLEVDTAADGREALDKARARRYELILMDVQMPEMDGLEATRAIRALPDWKARPILAMTANAFNEDRHACREAGMDDFVAKPVDPDALFAALLKWLPPHADVAVPPAPTLAATGEAADDPRLHQRLGAIPGLDLARGLAILRGNTAKYVQLLGLFADSHVDDPQRIAEWLAAGDLPRVQGLAHALKGSAGNLGALTLSAAADALQSAIRRNAAREEIDSMAIDLATGLRTTIAGIRDLPTTGTDAPAQADPARVDEVLERLTALLNISNVEVNDLALKEAGLLRTAFGAAAETLLQRIAAFDYDGAMETLRAIEPRETP
jgi:PAS domain S-box-containing protein